MKNNYLLLIIIILAIIAINTSNCFSEQYVYCRPFNLGGCINHGGQWKMPEDTLTVLNTMNAWSEKPTMLWGVVQRTDTADYSQWIPFINEMKQITPNLFFGIGDPNDTLTDTTIYNRNITIVKKFVNDTKCLAFENFGQTIRNTKNDSVIIQYLTDLHNIGFQHIMPTDYQSRQDGQPWPYIDAIATPVNKYTLQINHGRIDTINMFQPNAQLLLNYESPNGQITLDSLSNTDAINAMTMIADSQNLCTPSYRWIPVWSELYDAYQKGTLNWIAQELASVDTCLDTTSIAEKPTAFPTVEIAGNIIYFSLLKTDYVNISLYDETGRLVEKVLSGIKEKGCYKADIKENKLAQGIYFIKFSTGDYKTTKKLILAK